MTRIVLPLAAAIILGLAGCAPRKPEPAPNPTPPPQAAATPAVDPATPAPEPAPAANEEAAAARACAGKTAPPTAKTAPPLDAAGRYADSSSCWGCNRAWWRTTQTTQLRATPAEDAALTATVPTERWAFVRETRAFFTPVRGIVTKPDDRFKACEAVYFLAYNVDDDGGGFDLWRAGEVVRFDEESAAEFAWDGPLPSLEREPSGWWVLLETEDGKKGWAYTNATTEGFNCKWENDTPEFCATAPKAPPG